jgi:hypothetical protein
MGVLYPACHELFARQSGTARKSPGQRVDQHRLPGNRDMAGGEFFEQDR